MKARTLLALVAIFNCSFAGAAATSNVKSSPTTTPNSKITESKPAPKNNYVEKLNSGAQKALDYGQTGLSKINAIQKETTLLRVARPHNIMASYSGVSTWIPSKIGISYTYCPTSMAS